MCNVLYEQVRQVAQRSAERVVDPLGACVGRNLCCQACQQPSQRLGAVTLQREEVLELAYDPFYDLALARCLAPITASDHALRESSFGVAATSAP